MKRPMGTIQIQYDPETGKVGYGVSGLTHIEVSGLLTYLTHLHLNKMNVGLEDESLIVPATVIPGDA